MPPHEGMNTTHYSIVDRWQRGAVTYTLNDSFGAHVTAKGTGVLLNNEMDDFTIAGRGEPLRTGAGRAQSHRVGEAGWLDDTDDRVARRQAVMVVGTPGGGRIITAVASTLVNVIDYGMNIQEAVDAPRFHQQWQPEATTAERQAIPPDARRILEAHGHRFRDLRSMNHMCAIFIASGRYFGANDSRNDTGLALGY